MSDSDDTDILLLIPPDLFTVASSQSSLSPIDGKPIISEILEHVQLLEDRISAIESRDTSLDPSMFDGTESRQGGLNTEFSTEKFSPMNQFSYQRKYSLKSGNHCILPGLTGDNLLLQANAPSIHDDHVKDELSSSSCSPMRSSGDFHRPPPSTRLVGIDTKLNGESTIITGYSGLNPIYRDIEQQQLMFNGDVMHSKSPKKANEADKYKTDCSIKDHDRKFKKSDENIKHTPCSKSIDLLLGDKCHLWDERLSSTPKKSNSSFRSSFGKRFTGDDKNSLKTINGMVDMNTRQTKENNEIMTSETENELPMSKEFEAWQSQKFVSLSDFWLPNLDKSEGEMLKIKLEEEKFRREHCEQLIQKLQKRLLEQQEKVAVALRVDSEKSDIISQFQAIWSKFKARWHILEMEHDNVQKTVQDMESKHQKELSELQYELKKKSEELGNTNNLLNQSHEKIDIAMKEKIALIESHANELENYKLLVQTTENRYETLKSDYDKLIETNEKLEQGNKNLHQELYKERLKSTEVRSEMSVIHKALDTCEAELTVLRQEKENLMLKLKEEENRNSLLEKKKIMLTEELDNAQKSESLIKEEMKSVLIQQEVKRSELREVYQKQLDEVVNTKLKEFQAQLDAAELNFQVELDTKQRAIAECAARKIKSIIDKHQLEVNLLEEKHKEEKRLYDIRLSQTTKKAMALETQLSAQQDAKSRLAAQLHSLMEKQYHQALQIISTGSIEHLHQTHGVINEKSREINGYEKKTHDCIGVPYMEPVKLQMPKSERKQLDFQELNHDLNESLMTFRSNDESAATKLVEAKDFKKYIQMILQMQQPKTSNISNYTGNQATSPPVCREVPRKYYTKADPQSSNDEVASQQNIEEKSSTDFLNWDKNMYSVGSLRAADHMEMKQKPPWK